MHETRAHGGGWGAQELLAQPMGVMFSLIAESSSSGPAPHTTAEVGKRVLLLPGPGTDDCTGPSGAGDFIPLIFAVAEGLYTHPPGQATVTLHCILTSP